MQKADERARNWTFVVYPDSAPANWRDMLDELYTAWIESPLHDKDVDLDGEFKKPHWHTLLLFEGKKSFEQIKQITDSVNSPIPQKVGSAVGLVRYMIHMDNPEKHQYSQSEIIAHGGADLSKYFQPDTTKVKKEIQHLIREKGFTEYRHLMDYLLDNDMSIEWDIASRNTLFFNSYLASNRHGGKKDDI